MATLIFGCCAALCVGVTILVIKVVKETRGMTPRRKEDDDEWS